MGAGLMGCGAPDQGDTNPDQEQAIGTTREELALAGIDRIIPISFMEVLPTGGTRDTTSAAAAAAVETANLTFQQTGIQFRTRKNVGYEMPTLEASMHYCNIHWPTCPELPWSAVASDLSQAYPGLVVVSSPSRQYSQARKRTNDHIMIFKLTSSS